MANLARSAQPVELDLSRFRGRVPVELLGRTPFPPIGELPYLLTLPARGFYWFRLAVDVDVPRWHEERLSREDLPVLVLFDGWTSFFRDRVVPWRIGMAEKVREQLEQDVLPRFVELQRWYAAKQERINVRSSPTTCYGKAVDGLGSSHSLTSQALPSQGAISCRSRSRGRTRKKPECGRSRRPRSQRCASRRTSA